MIPADVKRFIQDEIRREMGTALCTALQEATTDAENAPIGELYPGMGATQPRPITHPWGYASVAPPGVLCTVGRVGEHIGNRVILGHRDKARKDLGLQPGESCLYDLYGNAVYLGLTGIKVGSKDADEPLVLGTVLKTFLEQLCQLLQTTPISLTTSPGNPVSPNPAFATALQPVVTQFLTNPLTNILSAKHKTERGGL